MSEPPREPFGREEFLDKPGIVGARWWQRSLEAPPDRVARRQAVQAILFAGGALALLGVGLAVAGASSSSDYRTEPRNALDMQKEFGWSFGANAEPLTFDGESKRPFDRGALARLADDLRPARKEHLPWYVPTLFQSPAALPRSAPKEEATPPTPLTTALVPIFTPAMSVAYRRGKALAGLFNNTAAHAMVVVDLPGPEAVAFAAGAASAFDPVFALDNWPHPRGVVPAHQTLAAAAYYQPLFARHAASSSLPLLVLDRRRIDAYTDDASQFDNRYLAQVPGAAALKMLGIQHVLYVAPSGTDKELDDLNDAFVLYAKGGLDVKLVGADAFGVDAGDGAGPPSGPDDDRPYYYYGSSVASNGWFWHDYPWIKLPAPSRWGETPQTPRPGRPQGAGPERPAAAMPGTAYVPTARATPFSTGAPGLAAPARPSGFGTVAVVVSVATGVVLGAKLLRSGSWNRSAGGFGG
jgi:hypothetical protein